MCFKPESSAFIEWNVRVAQKILEDLQEPTDIVIYRQYHDP